MNETTTRHQSLADILIRRFQLEDALVEKARSEATESGTRLEKVLAAQEIVTEEQLAVATGEYLDIPCISLNHFTPDEELLRSVPPRVTNELRILPIAQWGHCYAVAMVDPFDQMAMEELKELLRGEIIPYTAPRNEITNLLARYESEVGSRLQDALRDVDEVQTEIQVTSDENEPMNVEEFMGMGDDVPVVRIVNSMLIEALHRGASDIHVEPHEEGIQVRYRIDGVLYDEPSPPKYMQWAIASRLKIISNLDIAERRLPQDGRFTIRAPGRDVDVRVSLIPTVHGQKAVLRILDKQNLKPSIAALGLDQEDYEKLSRAVRQPAGLILVTGPTGSGKTTTLYSALQEINTADVNIITVEDPVEYQLPRVNQIQTNSNIGLSFASGLRSILRQDPDVIMVGEIRDKETASIAIQASLTGHLVLSTLHTNDAPGAVARLIHMGIEPFLITSSLILSQAQRIYRKLCHSCRKPREIPWDVLHRHGIDAEIFKDQELYAPKGCLHCSHVGYSGRDAVMEILVMNEDLRDLVLRDASAGEIRKKAIEDGMKTLRQAGLQRVCHGSTSIEEILRVTSSV
ncbi:MAG: Flp pilus assembly complex ATPase component TadA [Kiritimatiellae bacterium]|nr:Flp pilus assembly complex ATPase component TadA [Kiritimatiellia bacterium]